MRLSTSKSKNAILFYIIKSTYIDKKHSTKIVEKLGTLEEVKIKANGEDPYIWAKRYAEELTKKEKEAYWDKWRKEREIIRNMSNDEKKAFYNERERQYEEEYNE